MFFRAEKMAFQVRPTLWFFITVAFEIWLPVALLMRLLVQRIRLSAPAKVVWAAGRLAWM